MKISKILTEARNLISEPSRWNKGCLAANAQHLACDPNSAEATSWCVMGAIDKVSGTSDFYRDSYILDFLRDFLPPSYLRQISVWNDSAEHSDIMDVLKEAIDKAESNEVS